MSENAPEPKQTPLAQTHLKWGARMVEFGGWLMPVQYSSILEEHHAVRNAAGLFDISHMGEFMVSGHGAAHWLNGLLTNDILKLAIGQGQYTLILNDAGGVIDDLILYRLEEECFFLVVNASKITEDFNWMKSHLPDSGVVFRDLSNEYGALALQGPQSEAIFHRLTKESCPARNEIKPLVSHGHSLLVARTGYTGEDGFEWFFPASESASIWETFMLLGEEFGLMAAGLGARDSLRLEACLPLNGSDLFADKTPLEAGLGAFVSLSKASDFPGKAALLKQKSEGLPSRLMALRMVNKGAPPRPHYSVFSGETRVGEITSGTLSPTLGQGIGLAYLATDVAKIGNQVDLEVRGQRLPAQIVTKPFYKRL